ncbi:tetratricopeptide repeat protein [Alteribacillus bidgolensis]|uniref:Tetratricopeptide repeat-containing protein n=1 Tax=Alteribacillus bidgolensis TaxID=930129 RepID=A0A1G8GYU7_9BACI|nr:tetratricopeptide repeat protein [Alteribacillus bidgolensis]SDH99527.1 Tetratricopeptide repeat-containing protein [Alteribacillus bidgolensis]
MKIGRNDPCPCGSGKKYKKCCAGKVTALTYSKEEILYVQQSIYNYVVDHYILELRDYISFLIGDNALDSLRREEEGTLSIIAAAHWVLEKRNQEENGLIDEITSLSFWNAKQRRLLDTWKKTSLFSVCFIEEWGEKELIVQDMINGDTLHVETPLDFTNGPLGICFLSLVPAQQHWVMFGMPCFIAPYDEHSVKEAFHNFKKIFEGLVTLSKSLSFDEDPFAKVLEQYFSLHYDEETEEEDYYINSDLTDEEKQVMTVFKKHASQELRDEGGLDKAERIWEAYCEVALPIIKKPEAYAASLEYYMSNDVLTVPGATQKALGKKYDVSPNTISKRIQDFDDALMEYHMRETAAKPADPQKDRIMMERQMFILHKEMERLGLSSIEEIEAFQQDFNPEQALIEQWDEGDRAQLMLYDAMLEPHPVEKNHLIQKALKIDENQPDAYLQLAKIAVSEKEELECTRKAVETGRAVLGEDFINKEKGHFWLLTETRPFMRAMQQYASLLEFTDPKQAAQIYEEMLKLNPSDNQGIRYQLLSLYLLINEHDKASALIDEYPEESAFWLFHQAFIEYMNNGLSKEFEVKLHKAEKENPYIIDYIVDLERMPIEPFMVEAFSPGSPEEAAIYIEDAVFMWQDEDELMNYLKKRAAQ